MHCVILEPGTVLLTTIHEQHLMLCLNQVAPELWTATHPFRFMGVEVGCRMTIVRLPSQKLVLISPIPITADDRPAIDTLGTVAHLIAPNLFHHLYLGPAQSQYPQAKTWGVEGLTSKRPDLAIDDTLSQPGEFAETLAYLPFNGIRSIMLGGLVMAHETVFYHRPSNTLMLTDIAFNFDATFPFTTRLAAQVMGSYNTLKPSRLEKWATADKAAVAASVQQVLQWDFDRVIPSHGSIVETGGKQQFKAGYEWFLGRSL